MHFPFESPWKLRSDSDQNMQTEAFSAEKLAELIKAQAIKSQAAPSFDRFDIDKLKYEIGKPNWIWIMEIYENLCVKRNFRIYELPLPSR